MQYCLAAALLDGQVGLDTFTDQQVLRPEAQALIPKVIMRRIPGYEGRPSWVEAYNEVDLRFKDGRVVRERSERITEGALRGATLRDIHLKFKDCAFQVLPEPAAQELLELLDNLEDLPDIRPVADRLRGDSRPNASRRG
jgi:2-methylcitrate dehydratase PrpD